MCGLAGMFLKNANRSKADYNLIGEVISSLLVEASIRGRHATGLAIVDRDGGNTIRKSPVSAERFVSLYNYKQALNWIDNRTGALIGHTRYATKGSPLRNRNNHPIKAGTVIGTHNGSVWNDDELFDKYNLERYAEVDSEVLFRMFDVAGDDNQFFDDMLPNVRGVVSAVWSDLEFPEHVYVFKGNNPLEMVYIKDLKAYAYASTVEILLDGLEAVIPDAIVKPVKIPKWSVMRINTSNFKIKTNSARISRLSSTQTTSRGITSHGASALRSNHRAMCEALQFVKASDGSNIKVIDKDNYNKKRSSK
tara:strand:- start:2275 stop:3195 length:921 start_codon:yes stop_codon:yes gene_type:complete